MEPVFTPGTDWFSCHIPDWEKWLGHLKNKSGLNFLEIGSFEGRSAVWLLKNILTQPDAKLTCIDFFERGWEGFNPEKLAQLNIPPGLPVEKNFDRNMAAIGAEKKVTKLKGFSNEVLRQLPFDTFDFVYIDGSHQAYNVLTDAVLSYDLLKNGGIMIFDDYEWVFFEESALLHPKIGIDSFLKAFEGKYDLVFKGFQIAIRKK